MDDTKSPPCQLDTTDWCERHKRRHIGRQRELALADTAAGARFRSYWDKSVQVPSAVSPAAAPSIAAASEQTPKPTKLIFKNHLSPGDVLVMSAAIESLHLSYPKSYLTDVRTSCDAIYENNPRISKIDDSDPDALVFAPKDPKTGKDDQYPLIHQSSQLAAHFMHGYIDSFSRFIDKPLALRVAKPSLHMSNDEKKWISQVQELNIQRNFWIINAGTKNDYTAKGWGLENYQRVVDLLRDRVLFVQIGAKEHRHYALTGTVNLIGQTTHRQLIRLCWHAQGGLGPSTFIQHVFAAHDKPYVCLLGGREPVFWTTYPKQTTLHTLGALRCCKDSACWVSRTVPLGDGDDKDKNLCKQPVFRDSETIPRCMALITPEEVARAVERYHVGGALTY